MKKYLKNTMIGLFILAAIVLVVWFVLFLKPSVGDGKKTLYVRFSNINRIGVGTRVLFAGKPVGEVVSVSEIYDARDQPSDNLGRVYFYQLTLKIDSSVKVYNTDEIALQTSGLLGEKSIAIIPKAPPKGVTPKLITSQPIYAESVDPLENAFLEISDVANSIEETFDLITDWIKKNGDELGATVQSFGDAMRQVERIGASVNRNHLVDEVTHATKTLTSTLESVERGVNQLLAQNAFVNTGIAIRDLRATLSNIKSITSYIAAGQGTIGRIVKSDDLYLSIMGIMGKANTLINNINNFGLLFNMNKRWQRTHLRQAELINALDSPAEFKTYFENEVSQINTSMGRIALLIERAENEPDSQEILDTAKFKSNFAELMREVEQLSNNLQLFNQELMNQNE